MTHFSRIDLTPETRVAVQKLLLQVKRELIGMAVPMSTASVKIMIDADFEYTRERIHFDGADCFAPAIVDIAATISRGV